MNTVENLRKLADYIEQHVPQDKLEMSWYRSSEGEGEVRFKSLEDCGTSGCALGWAPFVEGLELIPDERYLMLPGVYWLRYSARIFPDLNNYTWNLVFSSTLSSRKSEVVGRLRNMAHTLEKRS